MATTIQISEDLLSALKSKKMYLKETYEEVLWALLEDTMELSEESKKQIELAKKRMDKGHFYTHEQVKKELGL